MPYVLIVCSYKSGACLTVQITIKSVLTLCMTIMLAIIKCMRRKLIRNRGLYILDYKKLDEF